MRWVALIIAARAAAQHMTEARNDTALAMGVEVCVDMCGREMTIPSEVEPSP